jgi:hypothetical protein
MRPRRTGRKNANKTNANKRNNRNNRKTRRRRTRGGDCSSDAIFKRVMDNPHPL